jgi:transposase
MSWHGAEPQKLLSLHARERHGLLDLTRTTDQVSVLRRSQALLWLDQGERVQQVAERLQVSRQSIYNWVSYWSVRNSDPIGQRLADLPRTGRPPTAGGIIDPWIEQVIEEDPRTFGYAAVVWTASLLRQHLEQMHQIAVSEDSVRRAIDRLSYRWKRPRYRLALRPDTWRQAKGGSNKACRVVLGPC